MSYSFYIDDFSRPICGGGNLQGYWSKKYDFKNFKVYSAYRNYLESEIKRKDFEESFTGQFMKSGFKIYKSACLSDSPFPKLVFVEDTLFSPTLNWFGISTYSPDRIFIKENKKIEMSLQGAIVPYNEKYKELFESNSCKYIKISDGENVLYENWTGTLPNKELVQSFLR